MFRRNISPPSSGSKNKQLCLPIAFALISCWLIFSTVKMEAICSSETSVGFQRTTRRYIPDDITIRIYRCENLKFCILKCHVEVGAQRTGKSVKATFCEKWRNSLVGAWNAGGSNRKLWRERERKRPLRCTVPSVCIWVYGSDLHVKGYLFAWSLCFRTNDAVMMVANHRGLVLYKYKKEGVPVTQTFFI
jgi:hypothetical protein